MKRKKSDIERKPKRTACLDGKAIDLDKVPVILSKLAEVLRLPKGETSKRLVVGVNGVYHQLEKRNVSVVVVTKESQPKLLDHILEAANLQFIPIRTMRQSRKELAEILKVDTCSCLALTHEEQRGSADPPDWNIDIVNSKFDELRDCFVNGSSFDAK